LRVFSGCGLPKKAQKTQRNPIRPARRKANRHNNKIACLFIANRRRRFGLFPIISDLLRLSQPQSAKNPSPISQKQPKPSLLKMQLQLFFFYHNKKFQ
jgi:hypothetical protein